jgi:hypothetical protein
LNLNTMLALVGQARSLLHGEVALPAVGVTGPVAGETHSGPADADTSVASPPVAVNPGLREARREFPKAAHGVCQAERQEAHQARYEARYECTCWLQERAPRRRSPTPPRRAAPARRVARRSSLVSSTSRTCVFDSLFMMLVAFGAFPTDAPRSSLPSTPDASVADVLSVLAEFSLTILSAVDISYSAPRVLATKKGLFLIFLRIVYKEADAEDDEHAIFFNADERCLLDHDRYAKVKHVDDYDTQGARMFAVFNSLCPSALRVEVQDVYQLLPLLYDV